MKLLLAVPGLACSAPPACSCHPSSGLVLDDSGCLALVSFATERWESLGSAQWRLVYSQQAQPQILKEPCPPFHWEPKEYVTAYQAAPESLADSIFLFIQT